MPEPQHDGDCGTPLDALGDARVQFWVCPIRHPRLPLRITVEWDGDLATCVDCGHTNKHPHQPIGYDGVSHRWLDCQECGQPWPCPTVNIDGAVG